MAPTREIATQIWDVISSIGQCIPSLRCHTFIGGMPVVEDKQKLKKCHIAVGTPGTCHRLIFVVKLCDQSNKFHDWKTFNPLANPNKELKTNA